MTHLAFTIRQAHVEDAPTLAAAQREIARTQPGTLVSRPHELEDDTFAERIRALATADNGRYVVAEKDGQLIGHALFDPLARDAVRHVVHLTIAAHPGWQGRGVGRALLEHLIEWARETPAVEKLELHVREGNDRAIALYRKLGFEEEGRLKRRVKLGPGQYLDDILMALWP